MRINSCQKVGKYQGLSYQNDPALATNGKVNAMNEVLELAAEDNATHLVWNDLELNLFSIDAVGSGYICKKPVK